jgi:protein-disulfide isomerase
MLRATMSRRAALLALALASCADAGLRREVTTLRARVDALETADGKAADCEARVARLEGFLAPYMDGQAEAAAGEPDPAATYAVPIDGNFAVGPADAPITLVLAFDFACPYCHRLRSTLAELQQTYGRQLRIVYKNFVVHPDTATLPALAACAAGAQGKFADMEALLWARGFEAGGYSRELVEALAGELKLDQKRFVADLDGTACKAQLARDQEQLARLGVSGTPASFVNGRLVSGAQPREAFEALVDEQLKLANERITAGTPAADYYRVWVLEKGKTAP